VKPVVIVGQMGVGKTTVGRIVAGQLKMPFYDSDGQIREITGLTGREIAERDGVPALHALELSVLLMALDGPPAIVAAAASVVDRPAGRRAIEDACCVWIDRVPHRSARPGDDHRRNVEPDENLERRRSVFERCADVVLSGPGGPEEYADRVVDFLSQPR
jgi:shikimate kinase